MKAIVKKVEKKAKSYPKLMISTAEPKGRIVLFTESGKGITLVLSKDDGFAKVGRYDTDWIMSAFIDFGGTVTLSND